MKKILLIMGCFAFLGTNAQVNSPFVPALRSEINQDVKITNTPKPPIEKSKTRGITRTYSHSTVVDLDMGGIGTLFSNAAFPPIWQDSTILQLFSTGLGAINYSSVCAVLDPSTKRFNSVVDFAGETMIDETKTYNVDSVIIFGAYVTPNMTGAVPGDKIRISITHTGINGIGARTFGKLHPTLGADVNSRYLTPAATVDTAIRCEVPFADSVLRIAGEVPAERITWDYTFTNADTGTIIKRWAFKPPTAVSVPPGGVVAVSVTFVSGATWIPNVDSVGFEPGAKAHFRPRFFFEGANQDMTYRDISEDGFDANHSGLMFSFAPGSGYYASNDIELFNTNSFRNEYLDVDWVLTCASCGSIGVNDVALAIENFSLSPNPSNGNTTIAFTGAADMKNTKIEVLGLTGNIVKTIELGNIAKNQAVKQGFETTGLASGLYLVKVSSDAGQRTEKLIVE